MALTQIQSAMLANSGAELGMRNRIINGAMVIDQRNAGASVTHSGTANLYTLDRMVCNSTGTPQFSVQRVSDAPAGFINSAKLTTTTSGTPASGDFSYFGQYIEGFNVADLGFGTSAASTVTVSFWVKSSLTGTFGGALKNSANNRAYPFSYSINSANTWEQKSVTIAGDTTGTWLTTNGIGMTLVFDTGSGSTNKSTAGAWGATAAIGVTGGVNLVATASATWQITGVQLEVGTVATPFEQRLYGQELALCQRYYEKSYDIGTAPATSTANGAFSFIAPIASSNHRVVIPFSVRKRATPTTQYWDLVGGASLQSTFIMGSNTQTNGVNSISSIQSYESNLWLNFVTGVNALSVAFHWAVSAEL